MGSLQSVLSPASLQDMSADLLRQVFFLLAVELWCGICILIHLLDTIYIIRLEKHIADQGLLC